MLVTNQVQISSEFNTFQVLVCTPWGRASCSEMVSACEQEVNFIDGRGFPRLRDMPGLLYALYNEEAEALEGSESCHSSTA